MRIVAGKFRGASLEAPKGQATRPTSDRVRAGDLQRARAWHRRPSTSTARACSTCSPAPARSGSKRCRAARALPVRRGRGRGARRHPPQCRGARPDRREQDLAARRDHARRGGDARAVRSRVLRPALPTGAWRARAASGRRRRMDRAGGIAVLEERADSEIAWPAPFAEIDQRRYGDTQIAIARFDQG